MVTLISDTKQWTLHDVVEDSWPPARCASVLTACESKNCLILFGGASDDGSYFNDVWTLDMGCCHFLSLLIFRHYEMDKERMWRSYSRI